MKRVLGLLLAVVVIGASSGCCLIDRMFVTRRHYPVGASGACGQAGCRSCGPVARRGSYETYDGGSQGTVAYPYYTNRGPRDFLAPNPRDIGP